MTARPLEQVLGDVRRSSPATLPPSAYRELARELEGLAHELEAVRFVVLSSFTTDLLTPYLVVEGARHGFGVNVFHGGWGQLEQALVGQDWRGSEGMREALLLLVRLEDLDPDVAFRYHAMDRGSFDRFAEGVLDRLDTCVRLFRERSTGPVLIANFAVPEPRPLGLFDAHDPASLTHRISELNRTLARRAAAHAGTVVWDYAGLVASRGGSAWTDQRLWAIARAPVSAPGQPALAAHLMRTLRGTLRPSAKCLVLDLDDTLWGGVVGDDGVGGIRLGDEFPGSAFKRFQRAVLGLRDRGILLAICSSNDAEVALEALSTHPEMLLRPEHFSAMRIDWSPKSENLRAIAAELNIGVDSLVFFDDNPAVRAEVRDRLPRVTVVDVPSDPVFFVDALANVAELDAPSVTAEDRGRAASVSAEVERRVARDSSASLGDFLASLEMEVEVGTLDELTTQRVAQLVAKTNQFNLTTRRRTQAEIEAIAARDDARVCWLRLRDRYGDMGLVCVGILMAEGRDAVVDSLVLSCRAANRGLEQAMLAHLAHLARDWGCVGLVGEYCPTARNHVVEGLYPALGFEPLPAASSGSGTRYRVDLAHAAPSWPTFLVRSGGEV